MEIRNFGQQQIEHLREYLSEKLALRKGMLPLQATEEVEILGSLLELDEEHLPLFNLFLQRMFYPDPILVTTGTCIGVNPENPWEIAVCKLHKLDTPVLPGGIFEEWHGDQITTALTELTEETGKHASGTPSIFAVDKRKLDLRGWMGFRTVNGDDTIVLTECEGEFAPQDTNEVEEAYFLDLRHPGIDEHYFGRGHGLPVMLYKQRLCGQAPDGTAFIRADGSIIY